MVDTPKDNSGNDKEDPVEDKPPEIQSKSRCRRHRSKSRCSKDSNTGTGEDNTSDDAKNNEDPIKVTFEHGEQDNGQDSLGRQATHEDSEDSNYLPVSEDEVSLDNEDFIVPEEPLE